MLSQLPKLFERNFAIGFFVPAMFLTGGLWLVLGSHDLVARPQFTAANELAEAVLIIFAVWLVALTLLALNHPLLRLLEGYPLLRLLALYGHYLPSGEAWFKRRRERRFENHAETLAFQATVDAARAAGRPEPDIPEEHATRLRYTAENLPAEAVHVLPSRLGNVFRASEVYSNVVYGLDAIPAWPRLQAVMPEHFRTILADSKAQIDFCANLCLSGALTTLVHLALALGRWTFPEAWIALVGAAFAVLGYELTLSASGQFGSYVKSAFDLYRADLARKLGLELPPSVEAERAMWRTVSRMMIYRSAARADELTKYRRHRDAAG